MHKNIETLKENFTLNNCDDFAISQKFLSVCKYNMN